MVKTIGVVGTLVACVGFLFAVQDAPDAAKKKEATIRAVLSAVNADKLGGQILDQMGQTMGASMGGRFEGFWKKFREKARPELLVDMCVPIYAKYFTQEDLDQFLAFCQSPIGKKFVEKQPLLLKDSMEAGRDWGKKIAEEAMKEFEEEEEAKKDGK